MDIVTLIDKIDERIDRYVDERDTIEEQLSLIEKEYHDIELKKINLENISAEDFEIYLRTFKYEVDENIKNFKSLSMPNFKKYFPQSYEEILKSLNDIVNDINNKIDRISKDVTSKTNKLKKIDLDIKDLIHKVGVYKEVLKYSEISFMDSEKAEEIKKFIFMHEYLDENERANIVDFLVKNILRNIKKKNQYFDEKNKEFESAIPFFETKNEKDGETEQSLGENESQSILNVRNSIRELLDTYKDIYVEGVDFLGLDDLSNIINSPDEVDLETVIFGISYCIDFINNANNSLEDREKFIEFYNKLKNIYITKYNDREKIKKMNADKDERYSNLENAFNELEKMSMSFYGSKIYFDLSDKDREYFEEFNDLLKQFIERLNDVLIDNEDNITIDLYNELMNEYNKYIMSFGAIMSYYSNGNTVTKNEKVMKSFIINDIDSNTNEPVVICDFCTRPLVDEAALSSGKNWKDEYSLLINELISYGAPLMLLNGESNVSNFTDKIDDFVCFDKDRNDKTGMHRYRATRNSNVRFVEEIVTLKPNTPIFNQVKSIILKYLPDAVISNDENFILYINFANMVKKVDKDGYNVAIRRLGSSNLMKLLHQNGKYKRRKGESDGTLKTELSEQDLSLLEEYISRTIEAYKKLNNDYGFNINFVKDDGMHKRKEV